MFKLSKDFDFSESCKSGSLEVMSLVMDETLWLRTEEPSPGVEAAWNGIEMPEIEEAEEAIPGRKSLACCDPGRRSGKRQLTKVIISEGQITRKGCTSTVSFGEETAFAGRRSGRE
jgi:hypothetical protein